MGSNGSGKERLKWTAELHDLFEKCVHQIGGPDRATPKGILRAMAIQGLTIYHVKSHLQKYRMSIFTREEDFSKGKFEKKSMSEMLPNFSAISAAQLEEALQIQMEAQRRLSDHDEVQRNLKMKIEAQSRFLDKITEEFKNRAAITKPIKPYSPILSLPYLSEESDQCDTMEFESDSEEVGTMLQARKRIKIQDNNHPQFHKFSSEPQYLSLFSLDGMSNNLFIEPEIGFPWNIGGFQAAVLPGTYNHLNI